MIYLYFDKNWVKILGLKKSLFGHEEVSFFSKKYETKLLEEKGVTNVDLLASAIKESLNLAHPNPINDKNVFLILPQNFFVFFRSLVPADIAKTAIEIFIKDKAKSLNIDIDNLVFNYLIKDNNSQKIILFYGIKKEILDNLNEVAYLVNLKIEGLIPETLSYFKLFEKTLRKEKKEIIFYTTYEDNNLKGYLYDSSGLLKEDLCHFEIKNEVSIEKKLKEKFDQLVEKDSIKVNRLILSGAQSENVRQDIFTKEVGVWTNPLKRIITNFHKDYLDKLILKQDVNFSILNFDVCFGAFIFIEEEKFFLSFNKKHLKKAVLPDKKSMNNFLIKKELIIFVISFIASFIFFILISRKNFNFDRFLSVKKSSSITVTRIPTNTPAPTPSFKKEDLKVKILNGSGMRGKASMLRDILKEKGYGEIVVGNADNFDYKKTEIKIKKDKVGAIEVLKQDLIDYLSSFNQNQLESTDSADLVIIIGADFK